MQRKLPVQICLMFIQHLRLDNHVKEIITYGIIEASQVNIALNEFPKFHCIIGWISFAIGG